MSYTYEDSETYNPEQWVTSGVSSSSNTLLSMYSNNTYIIEDSSFTGGKIKMNLGSEYDQSKSSEYYYDGCTFDGTDIIFYGMSEDNQEDGYKVNGNFNDCSFTIGESGQITINYYVWGNVNFSNCNFTVTGYDRPLYVQAYSSSNGNNELAITFENCTLNGADVTSENVKNLLSISWSGADSTAVTSVYVDNADGEFEKVIDHTVNDTIIDVEPESAEENTKAAEAEAVETLLEVQESAEAEIDLSGAESTVSETETTVETASVETVEVTSVEDVAPVAEDVA
jgi:hypothetical protein